MNYNMPSDDPNADYSPEQIELADLFDEIQEATRQHHNNKDDAVDQGDGWVAIKLPADITPFSEFPLVAALGDRPVGAAVRAHGHPEYLLAEQDSGAGQGEDSDHATIEWGLMSNSVVYRYASLDIRRTPTDDGEYSYTLTVKRGSFNRPIEGEPSPEHVPNLVTDPADIQRYMGCAWDCFYKLWRHEEDAEQEEFDDEYPDDDGQDDEEFDLYHHRDNQVD